MRSLYRARLRTLLGLVDIMIGIASVIIMISVGEIAKTQSRKDFEVLGTDILTVKPPDRLIGKPRRVTIGLNDALALAAVLPSVSEAAPRIQMQGSFRYAGKRVGGGSVQGVTASFAQVNKLLLAAVGSVGLIVGGIGVMNIVPISVTERRREIGVRRALGASRGDIQRLFLMALILTLGGGIVGVTVGTGAAYGISQMNEWELFVSPTVIVVGVGVSTVAGIFFGLQPAYQASGLDPIVALQGE